MCQNIYISSQKEIPEIVWNAKSPGFYIRRVDNKDELEMLEPILHSKHIYQANSHLGCSCGFSYGDWSSKVKSENHAQRVKDVADFANYLDTHKTENQLQIFSTLWSEFPFFYEQKEFKTFDISKQEFELDEMVILNVV